LETVVAAGNPASRSLTRMQIAHTRVRHPSPGGKRMFLEGVDALRFGGRSRLGEPRRGNKDTS